MIDEALVAGGTLIPTARRFGVGKSALGRHKNNCLAPKLAAAAKMVQPIGVDRAPVERAKAIVSGVAPTSVDLLGMQGLMERLARSLERLEQAADSAAGNELHGALAALSGQIHRGIEATAKLQGLYAEPEVQDRERFSITINLPDEVESRLGGRV